MESTDHLRKVLDFQVERHKYSVIANLPKNSTSIAAQAEEAGVDAVMVNIEGDESGYPGHLGSYVLHDAYIKDVLSTLTIPCGI